MGSINVGSVCSTGSVHYRGIICSLTADRPNQYSPQVHVHGTVWAGVWQISRNCKFPSWDNCDMSWSYNVGGHTGSGVDPSFSLCEVFNGPIGDFDLGGYDMSISNYRMESRGIDFYFDDANSGSVYVGLASSSCNGSGSGNWSLSYGAYTPPCDPNPVAPYGNAFRSVPSHPTNPNPAQTLPSNSVLKRIFDGSKWDITYPRTTLENIYKYPPLIRTLANNYTETDAFNIPFDTDDSPVRQNWGYYDNSYFYIYRDGLYDVSCSTCIIDRKPGVGPHNCNRNVDGNNLAWLKLMKNPSGGNATFLSGKTAHNYAGWINMNVHNILPLKAGDKIFARVGWQWGNGSTCDGVAGCQGGITYNMQCTIAGVNSGANTRMSIVPLVFFDEEISYT